MDMALVEAARGQLAPRGVLRAGINLSNFLLVTGKDEQGQHQGVSPDIAKSLAEALSVPLQLVPFPGPGKLADAIVDDVWDVANIACEAERAKTIHFSPAYCQIQATYLVPAGSPINGIEDVDRPGVKIATKARGAYDLWLTDHIKHATILRAASIEESFLLFQKENCDVLSGLRPRLLQDRERVEGSRVLPGSFTVIKQCIGCRKDLPEAAQFLDQFVLQARQSQMIEEMIKAHGVEGKLAVGT